MGSCCQLLKGGAHGFSVKTWNKEKAPNLGMISVTKPTKQGKVQDEGYHIRSQRDRRGRF